MKNINKNIGLVGLPLDMGAGVQGTRLGPEAIRLARLQARLEVLGYDIRDYGDLSVDNGYDHKINDVNLKNRDLILKSLEDLYESLEKIHYQDDFALVLGGDHSIALASGKALANKYESPGIIYFDAHGDINTESTSPSGNIHGMPVAFLLGHGRDESFLNLGNKNTIKAENIVYIGLSDLDPGEVDLIKKENIKVYSINDVHDLGIGQVTRQAISYLESKTDGIHVSFDVDCMDPYYAPGTGINLAGGLSFREARYSLEILSKLDKIKSMDLVEVNPLKDKFNQTANMAVDLLEAFFKNRI